MSQRAHFSMSYKGQTNQLDIDTLTSTLMPLASAIHDIGKELFADKEIKIMVNAVRPGSFIVDLELAGSFMNSLLFLLEPINLDTPDTIVTVFAQMLNLKKLLRGELADEIINNNNGTSTVVKDSKNVTVDNRTINIYTTNAEANNNIEKVFERLDENIAVDGVGIAQEEKTLFTAVSAQFGDISRKNDYLVRDSQIVDVSRARLNIIKIVFSKNRKWEFVYNGIKISAVIDDPEFWSLISDRKITFSQGDILICDMKITQLYDKKVGAYLNDSYSVVKFIATESPDTPNKKLLDLGMQ